MRCLPGRYIPTCSAPALYRCEGLWLYDVRIMHEMSAPLPPSHPYAPQHLNITNQGRSAAGVTNQQPARQYRKTTPSSPPAPSDSYAAWAPSNPGDDVVKNPDGRSSRTRAHAAAKRRSLSQRSVIPACSLLTYGPGARGWAGLRCGRAGAGSVAC